MWWKKDPCTYLISSEQLLEESLSFFLMPKIDNLTKALSEDVREIIAFHNLLVRSLSHHVEKVEASFTAVDQTDFVIAPLVIVVFI